MNWCFQPWLTVSGVSQKAQLLPQDLHVLPDLPELFSQHLAFRRQHFLTPSAYGGLQRRDPLLFPVAPSVQRMYVDSQPPGRRDTA